MNNFKNTIPENWLFVRLEEICSHIADIDHKMPRAVDNGVKFISAKDLLDDGTLNLTEDIKFISREDYLRLSRKIKPQYFDIIYSRIGARLGKARLVETNEEFLVSYSCCVIRPVHVVPKYLTMLLDTKTILCQALSEAKSIGVPDLGLQKIKDFILPLPPLNEQRRIVAKIDALFARSRRAREYLAAIPPLLEKLRQSVLAAAFRGDLTKEWREKNKTVEPASVLLERIRAERRRRWEETELAKLRTKGREPLTNDWKTKYVEPEPADTSDLPELPEGWTWIEMGSVCTLITDGKHGDCPNEENSGYYFLSAKDLRNNTLIYEGARQITEDSFLETHRRTNLQPGDICMVNTGATIGRISIAPNDDKTFRTTFQKSVAVIKCDSNVINNKYCSYILKSDLKKLVKLSSGSAVPNLLLGSLKSHLICLPSTIAEQEAIVNKIENLFSICDKLEERFTQSLVQADVLDQSILAKAFRGELVPQDPNDEPVSVLLERIKAERAASDTAKAKPKQKQTKGEAKQEEKIMERVRSQESEQAKTEREENTANTASNEESGRAMVQLSLFE